MQDNLHHDSMPPNASTACCMTGCTNEQKSQSIWQICLSKICRRTWHTHARKLHTLCSPRIRSSGIWLTFWKTVQSGPGFDCSTTSTNFSKVCGRVASPLSRGACIVSTCERHRVHLTPTQRHKHESSPLHLPQLQED